MNNPIMYADPSGHLPEWAAWLISVAAIVGGIVLTVATAGIGSVIGGALIGAGAGSLINGYVTEANGGDFTAGYIGGAISGSLCGLGAGFGGAALVAASEAVNFACMGSAMSSIAGSMGRVATDVNSKFALRFLAGSIAGGAEAAYDISSYLINRLIAAF